MIKLSGYQLMRVNINFIKVTRVGTLTPFIRSDKDRISHGDISALF